MIDELIEKRLIEAVYSDEDAKQFFLNHLADAAVFGKIVDNIEDSDSGDARMKGAFFVSKFDVEIIRGAEERLLKLMDDEWDSVAVHIMVALSRIQSKQALTKILENRVKPVLHWEAVALKNCFL